MTGLIESLEKAITKLYRKRAAGRLYARAGGVVQRGLFAGMRLDQTSHLSNSYMALKAYGLYETEVHAWLALQPDVDTLVNIGAGEGYYSIGLVRIGKAKRAISFELDGKGRSAIAVNAAANSLGDKIAIHGAAGADLVDVLKREEADPRSTVLLCDIEGGEFSVITPELVRFLSGARFAIELHGFAVADGEKAISDLAGLFAGTHDVEIVKAGPRDWSGIAEIEALNDLERALVTTEGRKKLGRWLFATPRAAA